MKNKKEKTENDSYESFLCSEGLFRYFIRKMYDGVEISNDECNEVRIEFAKYLFNLNLTELQKTNILPKSEFDVMLNMDNPLRMYGFEAAYVYHFGTFMDEMKKQIEDEIESDKDKQEKM